MTVTELLAVEKFANMKVFACSMKNTLKDMLAIAWKNSKDEIAKFTAFARTMEAVKTGPLVVWKRLRLSAIVPMDI